LEEFHLNLNL